MANKRQASSGYFNQKMLDIMEKGEKKTTAKKKSASGTSKGKKK